MGLIRALSAMSSRLQAEEALAAVSATALGTGSMSQSEGSALFARLLRTANGGRVPVRKATDIDLASVGIGVQKVVARRRADVCTETAVTCGH
jgi:hypothetical protein